MIYLFDDNQANQQEQYGCHFIREGIYKEYLVHLIGIPTHERADFLESLPAKASAVFFHSTSKDMDREGNFLESADTVDRLYNVVRKQSIPYVRFSWGHTSHVAGFLSTNIEMMNKRIFYLNLKVHVEYYIKTGDLDFLLLSEGSGYRKQLLLDQGKNLIRKIKILESGDIFKGDDFIYKNALSDYLKASISRSLLNSSSLSHLCVKYLSLVSNSLKASTVCFGV